MDGDNKFKPGESGNPRGRPPGSRNRASLILEELLEGEAAAIGRKAIEKAKGGDLQCLRLCLERLLPARRDRHVTFSVPEIKTVQDAAAFAGEVLYGPLFNLIYVASDASGRVIGHFTLYNVVGWSVVLAESGGTPNTRIALASNPLDPREWSESIPDEIEIDFAWLILPSIRRRRRMNGSSNSTGST